MRSSCPIRVIEIIPNACGWNGVPVVSREHGLVVVGGGGNDDVAEQPVLQGIDLASGQARFVVRIESAMPAVIEGADPRALVRAGGSTVFATSVYRHNVDGRLIVVDGEGRGLRDEDLGAEQEYPFVEHDVGTKLWTAIEPAGSAVPDGVVFTWSYRQGRRIGGALHVGGEAAPRWVGRERVVGVVGDRVVAMGIDDDHRPVLTLSDVRDGRVVIRDVLGKGALVAAISESADGGLVLLVDRTAQLDAWALREPTAESADHPGGEVVVRAIDAATGLARWSRAFEGDVLDVRPLTGFGATAIVVSSLAGDGTCEVVRSDGATEARFAVPGRPLEGKSWKTLEGDAHRVFGATRSGLLLYAVHETLFGIAWRDGGRVELEVPIPSARCFRRQVTERWLPQSPVAVDGDLLAITGAADGTHRLWLYDLAM